MESIKKLEEQLMMNQRNHAYEKIGNGQKDDVANVTSNKEVVSCSIPYDLAFFTLYIKIFLLCFSVYVLI